MNPTSHFLQNFRGLISSSTSETANYSMEILLVIILGGISLIILIGLVFISVPVLRDYNYDKEWINEYLLGRTKKMQIELNEDSSNVDSFTVTSNAP